MTYKVLVVDDEPLARERIKRLVQDIEHYEVCGEAGNGEESLDVAARTHPDIVLMDIRMPGMDGLEAAKQFAKIEHAPALIFCTAYDDYAIAAFKVNASDYLLKPVRKEALQEALERTTSLNRVQRSVIQQTEKKEDAALLVANTYKGTELIDIERTYYFRADQKYVTAYCEDGDILIDNTLKELETEFPDKLIRVHRNALVCRNRVQSLNRDHDGQLYVELRGALALTPEQKKVHVSRRHAQEVKDFIKSRATPQSN